MKLPLPITVGVSVLCITLVGQAILAQAIGTPRSYEDLLKQLPQQDLLKLRGVHKEEAAMEFSKKLTASEVGKEGLFQVKISKIENWPFPQEGITGWRVTADDDKVRVGSLPVDVSLFVYIRQDPTATASKLKRGQTILVTGKLSRCDMTAKDGPKLNMDLQSSSFTTIAK